MIERQISYIRAKCLVWDALGMRPEFRGACQRRDVNTQIINEKIHGIGRAKNDVKKPSASITLINTEARLKDVFDDAA
jgi:hypothetical protein